MDTMIEQSLTWRCTACGEKFDNPKICESCGTASCPSCKATNSLMNQKEWGRFVSSTIPLRYAELRKQQAREQKPTTKKSRKPKMDKQARIEQLLKET